MHAISVPRRLAGATVAAGLLAGSLGLTAAQADASSAIGLRGKTLVVKGTAEVTSLRCACAPATHAAPSRCRRRRLGELHGSEPGWFDRIVVNARDGNDQVRIDESNGSFTTTTPTQINGQGGDDTLLGGSGAETLNGGDGNDVVDGNAGADRVTLGSGDDRFVWDPGDGSDVVDGGMDTTRWRSTVSGAKERFGLSANGSHARFTRDVGGITIDLNGLSKSMSRRSAATTR